MIEVENVSEDPVEEKSVEIVERKGLGHPDSICDGVAEAVSEALSREYVERFGHILHHNTDEAQLVAGKSSPKIGGGSTEEKVYLLLAGRATKSHEGEEIDVDRIAVKAAEKYIEENFKVLSPEHFEIESRIGETSTDLEEVYEETLSNDTSFGVGHAPLSPLEETVHRVADEIPEKVEAVGEDVKVMGVKTPGETKITVAAAVISSRIQSLNEYREVLEKVKKVAEDLSSVKDAKVRVNTADNLEEESIYITETGTSAEMGDDGSVGRGNRVNGLITPNRSMSMEAASGKNPVTHVGKIYNLKADAISSRIHEETGEFAQVKLLSRIGSPITKPQAVHVETTGEDEEEVMDIVRDEISDMNDISEKAVEKGLKTF